MKSYDEILSVMKDKYEELSGGEVSEYSDVGIRMRALAGELYNIMCACGDSIKQSNLLTSTGEYLDYHGETRGVMRNGGRKAEGKLIFSRLSPLNYSLPILKGTVCENNSGLRYITTEDGAILSGETTAEISAEAEKSGEEYNCLTGAEATIIAPPPGIENCVCGEFFGGHDMEDDEHYRERILNNISSVPGALNRGYFESFAYNVPEACYVSSTASNNNINIYACDRNGDISDSALSEINEALSKGTPFGINAMAFGPTKKQIKLTLRVTPLEEYTADDIRIAVSSGFESLLINYPIGKGITAAEINRIIYQTGMVESYSSVGMIRDISCSDSEKLVLGTISVSIM